MRKNDEVSLEQAIQAKMSNGARLTPKDIDDTIWCEQFHVFPGRSLTVCCLTLNNGYCVTGESACVSPENFDKEIGERIARENARQKIWALEGYLLRERVKQALEENDRALDSDPAA